MVVLVHSLDLEERDASAVGHCKKCVQEACRITRTSDALVACVTDQAHAKHLGVEAFGCGGVAGDVGDVVETAGAKLGHVGTLRLVDEEAAGSSPGAMSIVLRTDPSQSPPPGVGNRMGMSMPASR